MLIGSTKELLDGIVAEQEALTMVSVSRFASAFKKISPMTDFAMGVITI